MPSMLTHKLFAEEAAEKLSFGMTEREKRARLCSQRPTKKRSTSNERQDRRSKTANNA